MTPSERLKLAGDAAALLEERGFVAVARLKDGVVNLELWKGSRAMGVEVGDPGSAAILAATCAMEFEAAEQGGRKRDLD
jgi:hypothetical protein